MRTPEELIAWGIENKLCEGDATARQLTGGLINRVWRVTHSGGSFIAKHTTDHIATAPDVPMDPNRQRIEARAMELASAYQTHDTKLPAVLVYDPARHVTAYQDIGDVPDIGMWLRSSPDEASIHRVFGSLGEFLATLHSVTASAPMLAADVTNDSIQATRDEVQYQAVRSWCDEQGIQLSPAASARAEAVGARFLEPGECLIMGDLWLRSILIDHEQTTWLIDWEFAHWGKPEQDTAHLLAHLFMAAHIDATPGAAVAARSFLEHYAAKAPTNSARSHHAIAHAACEVLSRTIGAFSDPARRDASREIAERAVTWLEDDALDLSDVLDAF